MKATKKTGNKVMGSKGTLVEKEPEVSIVEDETPDTSPEVTSSGTEIVEDLDESLGDLTAKPVVPVSAAIMEADTLEIVFLESLLDYPIIGRYNFQEKHGVSVIRKHQKFMVPRDVALTLYDKRLVTIPSMV